MVYEIIPDYTSVGFHPLYNPTTWTFVCFPKLPFAVAIQGWFWKEIPKTLPVWAKNIPAYVYGVIWFCNFWSGNPSLMGCFFQRMRMEFDRINISSSGGCWSSYILTPGEMFKWSLETFICSPLKWWKRRDWCLDIFIQSNSTQILPVRCVHKKQPAVTLL